MSKTEQLHQELKHKFVLQRLLEKGVLYSQDGKPIHECDYDTLKYELVLQAYRDIDVENENQRWF